MGTGDAAAGATPEGEQTHGAARGAIAQVFVTDLDALVVAPEDEHHLTEVLRARPGESVVASDGAGRWRICRFVGSPPPVPRSSLLEADGPVVVALRSVPEVTVAFVPVKGDRPEWVVQKLTEAGVDRIVVLQSRRAVVRWQGERRDRALDRLRRVARESAAQSRRPWLPEVVGVVDLEGLEALVAPATLALAEPGGDPPSLRAPAVAVGPEGGWDPSELADRPVVGLSPNVLRAETAAMAVGLLLCALREGLVGPGTPPSGSPVPGENT
jgi:16S rRNA (uracil1498-N3)-methyltransferase